MRTFVDSPAVRHHVPLLLGLVGCSSSGKTMSSLRLATGIQRVSGGDIFCIDTESRRALHYADKFTYKHVEFNAPFGPLDYLAAVEHCTKKGAKVVIIDSASHLHEGPGGTLEAHAAEVARLSGGDFAKAERVKFLAWAKPKAELRRFLNSILQLDINLIFCMRAKEKLKLERGKEPVEMGFQAISGDELVYELTVKCLLHPQSNGVPTWQSDYQGERLMMKLPEHFKSILLPPHALCEADGEALAAWARGGATTAKASPAPDPYVDAERDAVRSEGTLEPSGADVDSEAVLAAEVAEFWIGECHKVKTVAALAALKKRLVDAELPERVRALIRGPLGAATKRAGA